MVLEGPELTPANMVIDELQVRRIMNPPPMTGNHHQIGSSLAPIIGHGTHETRSRILQEPRGKAIKACVCEREQR